MSETPPMGPVARTRLAAIRTATVLLLATMLTLLASLAIATLTASPAAAADSLPGATETSIWVDSASWMLLAGVATPLLTSIPQQPRWTGATRTVVGVVVSVIVGLLTLLANGTLAEVFAEGTGTWLSLLALVVVTSSTAYKGLWKPSGVADRIETVTSPKSSSATPAGEPPAA